MDEATMRAAMGRLHAPVRWHEFPQHMVETLAELVSADLCSYGEVDLRARYAATASTISFAFCVMMGSSFATSRGVKGGAMSLR